MQTLSKKEELFKATKIGSICVGTYLASYICRKILSVFTPIILADASVCITKDDIAKISSVYMVLYAAGQLIFGIIGDYVKPKLLVSGGLVFSGIGLILFPNVPTVFLMIVASGMLGFGLSALRGPLVKVISENNTKEHSRFICVLLSFVAFVGPAVAGFMAMFLSWRGAYYVSAAIAFAFAVASYILLTVLEKKGTIVMRTADKKGKSGGVLGIFAVKGFIAYMLLSMINEVAFSSIEFWIPTYLNEYLGIIPESSAMIVSAISLIGAFCPFLCLVFLKLLKDRDMLLNLISFGLAPIFMILMIFVKIPILNITLYFFENFLMRISSGTIWSIYIPSLGKTGKVSSANGIMDGSGYAAAAIANLAFPPIMNGFGWKGTIAAWAIIIFLGFVIALAELMRSNSTKSNTNTEEVI